VIASFDADAAVKILNERKLDLSVEIEGETVLIATVERNLIDVLNALIKVLLDPVMNVGLLCISIARLCQCGAPVNQRVRGSIALHRGVLRGAYDAVNMLLRAGGGLETGASPMGLTALQMAASRGDERMVRMLLDNVRMLVGVCVLLLGLIIAGPQGAKPNTQNDCGQTALHIASHWGHAACVALLLRHGATPGVLDLMLVLSVPV
jgi:ankyrin repeat protein